MSTHIEIHALQTVPPSCINRDDTGTPKSAVYGGTMRARVSSQAWKRAAREAFAAAGATSDARGVRTKDLIKEVMGRVANANSDAEAVSGALLGALGMPVTSSEAGKRAKASTLTFLSPRQFAKIAETVTVLLDDENVVAAAHDHNAKYVAAVKAAEEHATLEGVGRGAYGRAMRAAESGDAAEKKAADAAKTAADAATAAAKKAKDASEEALKKAATGVADSLAVYKGTLIKELFAALQTGNSYDIALFGRMMAAMTDLKVDAAAQVAHALSVSTVEAEYDYWTAKDDNTDDGDSREGAAQIGSAGFNSSTLYRYATVNLDQLTANLDGSRDDAIAAATLFVDAFVSSMPTGKQTGFGNRTKPEVVAVAVRDDQPFNAVGAFESPVVPGDGFRLAAAQALTDEILAVERAYGTTPKARFVVAVGSALEAATAPLGEGTSLPDLADKLRSALTESDSK